jgi:hypothetical protein
MVNDRRFMLSALCKECHCRRECTSILHAHRTPSAIGFVFSAVANLGEALTCGLV